MTQNDNLYSAFKRPRETLGGIGSAIPQPSSALRRSNSGAHLHNPSSMGPPPRMSMVPQPRSSAAPYSRASMAGPSTFTNNAPFDPPQSAMKSARKSYAPMSSGPSSQQPPGPPSSARRSSAFTRPTGPSTNNAHNPPNFSTGTSFFPNTVLTAGTVKDPRPLKDRSWQMRIGTEILEYLAANGFEHKYQISGNFLKSPTQRDFNCVFEWLYKRLDPNYRFQKSIDQEVLPILKTLRYPYSGAITKSALAAVGGANTWPTFLGMLHWLLEIVRTMDALDAGHYEAAAENSGVDVASERIVFDFLSKSYPAWLAADDDHDEYVEAMVTAFDERVKMYLAGAEQLEEENANYEAQLKELDRKNKDGKTPLQVLEEEKETLEKDKEKFTTFIQDLEARIKKNVEANARIRDRMAELDHELGKLQAEKQALQRAVDKQGLTPADIDRMNTEREKLDKGLSQTSARIAELKIRLAEREQDAASKLDMLERELNRYNTLAYQIGIIPSTAKNAGGKEYELTLLPHKHSGSAGNPNDSMDLDDDNSHFRMEDSRLLYDSTTGYQPAQLVNRDLRHDIKPSLNRLRQQIGERIHGLQDGAMRTHEQIDQVSERLTDLKDELETLKARVAAAQAELDGIKETMAAETNASNTKTEKLERDLQALRIGLHNGVLSLEQRLQSITIEYDQLQHAADTLRQDLHGEVAHALNEIIKFKMSIQKGLDDYEKTVEEEASHVPEV